MSDTVCRCIYIHHYSPDGWMKTLELPENELCYYEGWMTGQFWNMPMKRKGADADYSVIDENGVTHHDRGGNH